MADLNIPKLNMKSDKYIFKKKLSLRRKTKKRLFIESAFMLITSLFLIYINYLIPKKNFLIQNLPSTLKKSFILLNNLLANLSEVLLVIFIFISYFVILILLIGSLYRIFRITNKKTRIIDYK
ncbi:nucleoside-diphosphate kinase [Prochlorococcus marinus str. XMU1419]|nr:nucleoside-diphosphate kinase [Prochlorococcus marinus str. XMU1419]